MRKIQVVSHIDYLTVSYGKVNKMSELGFMDSGVFGARESVKPIAFYDEGYKLRCGGMFYTSKDDKQGSRLDLSGQPLQNLRDNGLTDAQILMLTSMSDLKKRTTRIDYCWTIRNAGMVDHTVNHWKAGKVRTTFRNDPTGYVNFGSRHGQTVYYGSKDNPRRVVFYDKGEEMGLLNEALLRVEMRLRDEFAGNMVIDASQSSVLVAARSHLLSILDFPCLQWWRGAIHGESIETSEVPKRPSKWRQWLGSQVGGSIKQHLIENEEGDREFIRQWLREMVQEFNKGEN